MQMVKLYQTKIECSSYNVNIDSIDTTITVSLIDFNGNPVTNTKATISVDKGYFTKYNDNVAISGTNTKSYNGTTGSDGKFTMTYNASEWGLVTFSVDTVSASINVTGWKKLVLSDSAELYVNESIKECILKYTKSSASIDVVKKDISFDSISIPNKYKPPFTVVASAVVGDASVRLTGNGEIIVYSQTTHSSVGVYGTFVYPIIQ